MKEVDVIKLDDEKTEILSSFVRQIKTLNIRQGKLTTRGFKSISKAVEQRKKKVNQKFMHNCYKFVTFNETLFSLVKIWAHMTEISSFALITKIF